MGLNFQHYLFFVLEQILKKYTKPLWILLRSGSFIVGRGLVSRRFLRNRLSSRRQQATALRFYKEKISTADFINHAVEIWSKWRDSNSRPPVPETGALPPALHLVTPKYYITRQPVCQEFSSKFQGSAISLSLDTADARAFAILCIRSGVTFNTRRSYVKNPLVSSSTSETCV